MPSFKKRSYQKEFIDRDDIPFEDIKRNMQELDLINRRLGGHAITVDGIRQFEDRAPMYILEIGCGGGDNLRAIRKWAQQQSRQIRLTGVDINPECIAFAKTMNDNDIEFVESDYRKLTFDRKPDVIFASLFCHHFTDEELVSMLHWLQSNSRLGFFINDLHRHPLAYYSIKLLTRFLSKSWLVKNDAPLSVLRGMKRQEWKEVFSAAGMPNFKCSWKWAFRWLITYTHDERPHI